MRIALVLTIKNESRLLLQNIRYHLAIGFEQIFVYFDGTTDGSDTLVQNMEGVKIANSINADRYAHHPGMSLFCSTATEYHTARQCLNTYDALQQCKLMGMDWLVSLDADELFLTDKCPISLNAFFEDCNDYDVIQFKTLEVLGRQLHYDFVMAEETLFKTQKNFLSKWDQLYFDYWDPYNKKNISLQYWFGHNMGKCAINVQSAIVPKNPHRYLMVDGSKPKVMMQGYLLHYNLYDFDDFIKKFTNFKHRPDTFLSGNNIETLRKLWLNMVNDPQFDDSFLFEYYKKHLWFCPKKVKRLSKTRYGNFFKRRESAITEITYPKIVLEPFFES